MNLCPSSSPGTPPKPWFERYRQTPFPVAALPPDLGGYVTCQASRFGVNIALTATSALAQLAGALAENQAVRSLTGTAVSLPFNVIIAAPPGPGPAASLRESQSVFRNLQSERLQTAASLDRKAINMLRHSPPFRLPDFARPVETFAPPHAIEARLRAIRVAQRPLFLVESPGARDLRQSFAASHDQTLLVTYSDGLLEQLPTPSPSMRQLAELLARLCSGGQIHTGGKGGTMVEARIGLLILSEIASLDAAITAGAADVRTVIRNSILLRLRDRPNSSTADYGEVMYSGAYWRRIASTVLEARLRRDGIPPHPSFHEPLFDWDRRLRVLTNDTPPNIRPHLGCFYQLPAKLASLLIGIGGYGGFQDRNAAEAAVAITEYLMAQTVIAATDAHQIFAQAAVADAREQMLTKIIELGPIAPWRLREHFKRQSRAVHQPVLDALLQERRVRLDPSGNVIAT